MYFPLIFFIFGDMLIFRGVLCANFLISIIETSPGENLHFDDLGDVAFVVVLPPPFRYWNLARREILLMEESLHQFMWITCRVSYISGGAGCLPSTVWTQLKVSLYIPMIGHGLDGYCESMAGVNCYFCILAGIYFELANSPLGFMFRRFLTFYFGVRTIPVALWYSRY